MRSGQESPQVLGAYGPRQTEPVGSRAAPATPRFTAAGVVLLDTVQALSDINAVLGLLEVVPLLPYRQLADGDHVLKTDTGSSLAVETIPRPTLRIVMQRCDRHLGSAGLRRSIDLAWSLFMYGVRLDMSSIHPPPVVGCGGATLLRVWLLKARI